MHNFIALWDNFLHFLVKANFDKEGLEDQRLKNWSFSFTNITSTRCHKSPLDIRYYSRTFRSSHKSPIGLRSSDSGNQNTLLRHLMTQCLYSTSSHSNFYNIMSQIGGWRLETHKISSCNRTVDVQLFVELSLSSRYCQSYISLHIHCNC